MENLSVCLDGPLSCLLGVLDAAVVWEAERRRRRGSNEEDEEGEQKWGQ